MGRIITNDGPSNIRPFLEPDSIALVGVPRRTGRASFNILETLLTCGFPGKLYPVNPNADSLLGVKVYPDTDSLPHGIELAVIMVPRDMVLGAVRGCARRGIKAAIIVSEGFAEAGKDGQSLQVEVVEAARATGMRLVGPNSLGSMNNFLPFSSSFLPPPPVKAPVALVSQSGGFLEGFSDFVAGKAIDLGNTCDVDFVDCLEYLETDPDIRLIVLHIEGMKRGRRFLDIARRVSRQKPILALKTGRTGAAARVIASHSGSLAGQDRVYDTAFACAGIMRVKDGDELSDVTRALLHLSPLKGNRIGIVTPTGGCAIMAVDALVQEGLELAQLSTQTVEQLREYFSKWAPPKNPLDMLSAGMSFGYKKVYTACLQGLLDDPEVDAVICIAGWPTVKTIQETAHGKSKPVVTWVQGRWTGEVSARLEDTGYKTAYPTPERAARALSALRQYSSWKNRYK
ncbi:MAG: CoA-binding protein [Chloroflexi bacterium]|nr:CoA-binding protein [Chloroflexota bacterium]